MNLNDNLYAQFTPRERLALFYEAMARGDHAEADRLGDTCEHKTYRMQDAAYLQNMQYIHLACLYALIIIREAESRALAAMGLLLLDQEQLVKDHYNEIKDAYVSAIGEILGTLEAWREFCAIAGVDPNSVMMTCWAYVPRPINEYRLSDQAKAIEANPQAKARALSLFMGHWSRIQGQQAA